MPGSVRSRSQDKNLSAGNFDWEVTLGNIVRREKWDRGEFLIKLVTYDSRWSLVPPTGTLWELVENEHLQDLGYSSVEAYSQELAIP